MKKTLSFLAGLALVASPALAFASSSITLVGGGVEVRQGQPFVEPGYSAFSTTDGDITSLVITSNVNTNLPGDTFRLYSVTDSVGDSADASRPVSVMASAGTQPYCSSPSAPGWRVDLPGGGCGGHGIFVRSGQTIVVPVGSGLAGAGKSYTCPDWFPGGCMIGK